MARPFTISTTRPFKGLRTNAPIHTLEKGEFGVLSNFDVDRSGALRRRKGIWHANSTRQSGAGNLFKILGITRSLVFGSQINYLWATNGNNLYKSTNNNLINPAWITIANLTGQMEDIFEYGTVGNPYALYGVRRNGATFTVIPSTNAVSAQGGPLGTATLAYKTRQWVINSAPGTPGEESRIYFSGPNNFTQWTAPSGGFIDINVGDGQFNVSLHVYNDLLYVFKNRSIYIIDASSEDQTTYTPRLIHPDIGSVGRKSVATINGFMYFCSHEGVFRTDGTTFEEVSEPIRNIFQAFDWSNMEQNIRTEAVNWDGKYVLNRAGTNPHFYVFDTIAETWCTYSVLSDNVPFIGMVVWAEGPNEYLIMGDQGNGLGAGGWCWITTPAVEWYRDGTDGSSGGTNANDFVSNASLATQDYDTPGDFKRNYWNALDVEGTTADDLRLIPSGRSPTAAYQKTPQSLGRLLLRFPGTGRSRFNQLDIQASTLAGQTPGPLKIYGVQTADSLREKVSRQA